MVVMMLIEYLARKDIKKCILMMDSVFDGLGCLEDGDEEVGEEGENDEDDDWGGDFGLDVVIVLFQIFRFLLSHHLL